MTLKTWENIFFLFNLIGIIPILMSAFNIYREPIQANIFVFLIPLWIGIIGGFVVKKLTAKKNEQEMREFLK